MPSAGAGRIRTSRSPGRYPRTVWHSGTPWDAARTWGRRKRVYSRFHKFASLRTICVMHKKCREAVGVAVFDDSEWILRMYFALKPFLEEKNSHAHGLTALFMFMYYANRPRGARTYGTECTVPYTHRFCQKIEKHYMSFINLPGTKGSKGF